MIEYLLKVEVVSFKSSAKQKEIEKKIIRAIADMNYVGGCRLFRFSEGEENIKPRYRVPSRKNLPAVYEEQDKASSERN